MIGSNTMELNEATMIRIVQFWLDNQFVNPQLGSPAVKSVKGSRSNGYSDGFTVLLESAAPQPPV